MSNAHSMQDVFRLCKFTMLTDEFKFMQLLWKYRTKNYNLSPGVPRNVQSKIFTRNKIKRNANIVIEMYCIFWSSIVKVLYVTESQQNHLSV